MKKHHLLLPGFCLLVCAQSVFAENQKMVQHGSHEHGVARMTIATTETGLELALETPAANVFGFEHKASTEEDHHTVHEAVEKLEAGGSIFSVNAAAGCAFDKAVVESNIASHDKEKHDDHDDHKDEKHDDDHDDHKGETHSDVDVTWAFNCEKPASIESVTTKLFSAFPNGFEELDVEWVTANGAGKVELNGDDTITLK